MALPPLLSEDLPELRTAGGDGGVRSTVPAHAALVGEVLHICYFNPYDYQRRSAKARRFIASRGN